MSPETVLTFLLLFILYLLNRFEAVGKNISKHYTAKPLGEDSVNGSRKRHDLDGTQSVHYVSGDDKDGD